MVVSNQELGQAPMLQVFLTPRQALSSHPGYLYYYFQIQISRPLQSKQKVNKNVRK